MCFAVDNDTLMIPKVRFKYCFGVIITSLCILMCYARKVSPPFESLHLKLEYALDSSEDTVIIPGQEPKFRCIEAFSSNVAVKWLKDNVLIGEKTIVHGLNIPQIPPQRNMKRHAVSQRPQRWQSYLQLRRRRSSEHESLKSGRQQSLKSLPHSNPQKNVHESNDSIDIYSVCDSGYLHIHKVDSTSSGEYKCIISTAFGTLLRRKFYITVAKIPQCSIKPAIQTVSIGGIARLYCAAVSDFTVDYTWFKDGKPLPQNNNRFIFLSNGVLQIFKVEHADAGSYNCTAQNKVGKVSSPVALLKVESSGIHDNEELGFFQRPQNLTVVPPYSTAVFECLATSNFCDKAVVYGWTKTEGKICPDQVCPVEDSQVNLLLNNISAKSGGHYNCIARCQSSQSRIESTAYLDVLEKPTIMSLPKLTKPPVLSFTVRLSCSMIGNPPPRTRWLKNGVEISDDNNGRIEVRRLGNSIYLSITNVIISDNGYYQCIGENEVGSVSAAIALNIDTSEMSPPPLDVQAEAISNSEIFVKWRRPNTTKAITAYVLYYGDQDKLVNSSETSLTLHDLQPYTTYKVSVIAYLQKAPSNMSKSVQVQTMESVPCGVVQDMSAIAINTTYLLLSWKSLPKADQCGIITHYKVICANGDEDNDEITIELSPRSKITDGEGGVTEFALISDLNPGTNYGISVSAATKVGYGEESDFISCTTLPDTDFTSSPSCKQSYSGVIHASGHFLRGSNKIIIHWELQHGWNMSYTNVTLHRGKEIVRSRRVLTEHRNVTFHSLVDSEPYMAKIEEINKDGVICNIQSFAILPRDHDDQDTTNNVPADLQGTATIGGCIILTWKYSNSDNNGVQYVVRYAEVFANKRKYKYIESSNLNITICGLHAFSSYEFAVAVLHGKPDVTLDDSLYSNPGKIFWTSEEISEPPTNVYCDLEEGKLECSWDPPKKSKGKILNYVTYYTKSNSNERKNKTSFGLSVILECLEPKSVYKIQVAAVNGAGTGARSPIKQFLVPIYDTSTLNCTFEITSLDDADNRPVIVGVTIGAICLIICGLLLYCVPRRCKRKQNDHQCSKPQKPKQSNRREGTIVIGSLENRQNGHVVKDSLLVHEIDENGEQRERLLPQENGDGTKLNGIVSHPMNGVKNGHALNGGSKHIAIKNGLVKQVPKENGLTLLPTSPTTKSRLNGYSLSCEGIKWNSKKRSSFLLDSVVRSLTSRNHSMPETEKGQPHNQQLLLSVPIPKHYSKPEAYCTSNISSIADHGCTGNMSKQASRSNHSSAIDLSPSFAEDCVHSSTQRGCNGFIHKTPQN